MAVHNAMRAVKFIMNHSVCGIPVRLKADGSVPATLRPPETGWTEEWLLNYLVQELRLGNFQEVYKTKGYGSIFLTTEYADSVLHIRAIKSLDDWHFHYMD